MLDAVALEERPATGPPPPAAPRLEIPAYDIAAALGLERELGISHVLSQVLVRRGFTDPVATRAFLSGRVSHDPSQFAGIEAIVDTITAHIKRGSRIVVHGDYDVDGVCATAVLVRGLGSLGANVGWFVPSRLQDGYGISLRTIERLAARGTDLLITVDCGIAAAEESAAARAAGVEMIVTDHHSPPASGRLPDCPVLHPAVCGYPWEQLCGTGVAYKLAEALGAPNLEDELELVALSTVADLVALQDENRTLVRAGLDALANTSRPGLRALMRTASVDPSAVSAHSLGFRLAPRINAAGRLQRADAGIELLLTDDERRADEIAAELERLNAERQAVERRTVWEAEDQLTSLGARSAFVLASPGWHPGVIGIVASRIVERYHRPAILIAIGADGVGHGSGRGIAGFDLLGALDAASEQMERYGGHRMAAGLKIHAERIDAFREAIEAHAESVLTPELLTPLERVDAIVSGRELGLEVAAELEQLQPCGIGNPAPRLLVPGARFGALQTMGEGRHARFSVASGGALARAVAFGCDGKLDVDPGSPADATFRLERNAWNGTVEPRLVLLHAQPCRAAPVETLGEPERYLDAVLEEADAASSVPLLACPTGAAVPRTVIDRRGASPLAVLGDACAAGGAVLAVCSDVPRRLGGLAQRTGGFALTSHDALERGLVGVEDFSHVVVLDPPTSPKVEALLQTGSGFTHLAWSGAELRFAQQIHELEYGLRTSLVTLYRNLRERRRVAGEELERLLRGDGPHGRSARLAGRLIKVLAELELVSLDRNLPALEIAGGAQTELQRSPTYRACEHRYEDGRQFLSRENLLPSA